MLHNDGKHGREKALHLPSVRCSCIKFKADNAEITCTSVSMLFQLICLGDLAQFPEDKKTRRQKI